VRYETEHPDRPLFGVPWCIGVFVLAIATMIAAAFHIRLGFQHVDAWPSITAPGGMHMWLPVIGGLVSLVVFTLGVSYLLWPARRPTASGKQWMVLAFVRWSVLAFAFVLFVLGVFSQWVLATKENLGFAGFAYVNGLFAGWLGVSVVMGVLMLAAVAFHAFKAIRVRPS